MSHVAKVNCFSLFKSWQTTVQVNVRELMRNRTRHSSKVDSQPYKTRFKNWLTITQHTLQGLSLFDTNQFARVDAQLRISSQGVMLKCKTPCESWFSNTNHYASVDAQAHNTGHVLILKHASTNQGLIIDHTTHCSRSDSQTRTSDQGLILKHEWLFTCWFSNTNDCSRADSQTRMTVHASTHNNTK